MKTKLLSLSLLATAFAILCSFQSNKSFAGSQTKEVLEDGQVLIIPAGSEVVLNGEEWEPNPTDITVTICPGEGESCVGSITINNKTYSYNSSKGKRMADVVVE